MSPKPFTISTVISSRLVIFFTHPLFFLSGLEHVSYSRGSWLGDKTNPLSRVWYCGNPKILSRSEASGSNPAKLSLNLLEAFFVREEMAASNINGARGRDLLDPIKIKGIQGQFNGSKSCNRHNSQVTQHNDITVRSRMITV